MTDEGCSFSPELVLEALREAVEQAIEEHRLKGRPMVVRRDDQRLLQQLNKSLTALTASGELDRIIGLWLGD